MQVLSTCSSHWYAFTCHVWKMRRKMELVLLLLLEIVVVTWFIQWKRMLEKLGEEFLKQNFYFMKNFERVEIYSLWNVRKNDNVGVSAWHFLGKVIQMHLNLVFWRINSKCPIWMKVSFHINIKTSSATEKNCWWRIKIGWIFSEEKKMRKQFAEVNIFLRNLWLK